MVGDRLGQSRSGWGVRNGGQNSILGKGQAVGKASVRVLGVQGCGHLMGWGSWEKWGVQRGG